MQAFFDVLNRIAKPLLKDFVFPMRCVGCGKINTFLCSKCKEGLILVSSKKCLFCGKISGTQVCERCRKDFRVKNVFVAVYYREGAAKNLVINLKFGAKKELTTVMGDLMMRVIDKSKVKDYVLVPVPLDKSRGNERGFNQSELLAKEVARGLGLSVINVLGKKKRLPQMNLGKKERSQNLKDAFYTAKPVPKKVLLVDDVLTTGATVRECVRVLKENGAREVSIAVFARD